MFGDSVAPPDMHCDIRTDRVALVSPRVGIWPMFNEWPVLNVVSPSVVGYPKQIK
jgi:hypothetical protein